MSPNGSPTDWLSDYDIFDAAFVSADRDLFRAPFLDEIYIRALG